MTTEDQPCPDTEILDVLPPRGAKVARIEPTEQQQAAITQVVAYVRQSLKETAQGQPLSKEAFVFSGIAGAGKTTCASFVIKELTAGHPDLQVGYLGSTHRARIQLEHRLTRDLGHKVPTHTVWSAVFYTGMRYFCVKTAKDAKGRHETVTKLKRKAACEPCADRGLATCGCPLFTRCSAAASHLHCDVDSEPVANDAREAYPFSVTPPDLLYVDEGSMVTGEQMEILKSWGIPVIMSGDHAQLGPVTMPDDGPEKQMCREMQAPDVVLDQPMRQDPDSALFRVATAYRNGAYVPVGRYDENVTRLEATDPRIPEILARFQPAANRVVITPWNAPRALLNRVYHQAYYPGGVLCPGERVVAARAGTGYAVDYTEADSLHDVAAYYKKWDDVEKDRRTHEGQIVRLNRKVAQILEERGAADERALAQGSDARARVVRMREEMARMAAGLAELPVSRREHTVNKGFGWAERVQEDPRGDRRYLYVLLRLESPYPWDRVAPRVAVRMARDQLGAPTAMTQTTAPAGASLWFYGHAVTAWNAQGGEWDDVIALGVGWQEIYQRAGYVSASRARQRLIVVGGHKMARDEAVKIAGQVLRLVLE